MHGSQEKNWIRVERQKDFIRREVQLNTPGGTTAAATMKNRENESEEDSEQQELWGEGYDIKKYPEQFSSFAEKDGTRTQRGVRQ